MTTENLRALARGGPRLALAVVLLCGQVGCIGANLPKMQGERPIEIDHGLFSPRYKQEGRAIDPNDMRERLAERPETASDVKRAETLKVVGMLLGAVGGAMIGIPLGQKIAGNPEPIWPLAYAGLGAVTLAIPIGVWSDVSLDSAVKKHNQRVPFSPEPSSGPP